MYAVRLLCMPKKAQICVKQFCAFRLKIAWATSKRFFRFLDIFHEQASV